MPGMMVMSGAFSTSFTVNGSTTVTAPSRGCSTFTSTVLLASAGSGCCSVISSHSDDIRPAIELPGTRPSHQRRML